MTAYVPLSSHLGSAAWASGPRQAFASVMFSGKIDIHPVLVKDTMYKLPFSLIPQVAFTGRSNVGKSSLINALVHGREIARPSALPGRTRQLFTFDVSDAIGLVDLPGYGYAGKVGKPEQSEWTELVQEYIKRANALERIVSLIDSRYGLKKMDEEFWKSIQQIPIHPKRKSRGSLVVVLTKCDLVEPYELSRTIKGTLSMIDHYKNQGNLNIWPYLHTVSAESSQGIKELRCALSSMCPLPSVGAPSAEPNTM